MVMLRLVDNMSFCPYILGIFADPSCCLLEICPRCLGKGTETLGEFIDHFFGFLCLIRLMLLANSLCRFLLLLFIFLLCLMSLMMSFVCYISNTSISGS